MDNQPINFSICQTCKINPAVYGDGISWSRCSKCELEFNKGQSTPESAPQPIQEGFSHKLVQGLVSIIMPLYNVNYPLFHYTGTAIGAVRAHSKKGDYELIIVDNGSPVKPPTPNSYYAEKVVINEKNEGFTKAVNQGIRVSFGEYIVLLNNDTQVYEGWLEDMKRCLDAGLDLVMATPMYSLTEPFARWVEAEAIRDRWANKPIQESFSDFKDFSCVMFKKELMNEVGMFDEQFFNYASDSDLFKRMDETGKKYASTKAVAIHHIIDATGASVPETPEIMNEDKRKFEDKWKGGKPKMELITEEFKFNPDCTICQNHEHQIPQKSKREDIVNTDFTGDKVFLIVKGETHWIKSPEVLTALGAGFDDVKKLEKEEFNKLLKGEDIDMANVERYSDAQI